MSKLVWRNLRYPEPLEVGDYWFYPIGPDKLDSTSTAGESITVEIVTNLDIDYLMDNNAVKYGYYWRPVKVIKDAQKIHSIIKNHA